MQILPFKSFSVHDHECAAGIWKNFFVCFAFLSKLYKNKKKTAAKPKEKVI